MKRVIAVLMILLVFAGFAISAEAIESPVAKQYYSIDLTIRGTGEAKSDVWSIEVGTNDTCTFTAKETTQKFVSWNIIDGDYDIVSGNYEELTFTIRPKTDIKVIAVFDDGLMERAVPMRDKSSVSPNTSDKTPYAIIGIVLVLLVVVIVSGRKILSC